METESTLGLFVAMVAIVSVFGGTAVLGSLIERLINENDRLEAENQKLRKGVKTWH